MACPSSAGSGAGCGSSARDAELAAEAIAIERDYHARTSSEQWHNQRISPARRRLRWRRIGIGTRAAILTLLLGIRRVLYKINQHFDERNGLRCPVFSQIAPGFITCS